MAKKKYDIEAEIDLILRAQNGDASARRELHTVYHSTVEKAISQVKAFGLPEESLRVHAHKLVDGAIDTYQRGRGTKPQSWITTKMQKLNRYVGDNFSPVRNPNEYIRENMSKFRDALSELRLHLGQEPTDEQILAKMNEKRGTKKLWTAEDVRKMRKSQFTVTSGSQVVGGGNADDDESTLTALDIANVDDHDPFEDRKLEHFKQRILQILNGMEEKKRLILLHSFGIHPYEKLSLINMALRFGTSKYNIEQLHAQALKEFEDRGGRELVNEFNS